MQAISIKIEKPAYGGYGLGFHDGKACFVRYAVPGDEAIVELYQEKKDYCFGRITELTKSSESRIEPECPNFGICGGCDYLDVEYRVELSLKKEIVLDTMRRTGRFSQDELPELSVISDERFHYRSHASIKASKSAFGFYEKDSKRIVAFPESGCLLLAEELIEGLDPLPKTGGEIKIGFSGESGFVSSLDKDRKIIESERGIIYERELSLFFQANRFLRGRMLDTVKEYAQIDRNRSVIDIGCGVGFFTLHLAKNVKTAVGIDIDKESITWARRNAKLNMVDNAIYKKLSASELSSLRGDFKTAIADPPRAGLTAKAREALKAASTQHILYVSCDPSTFARDARDLVSGGRRLRRLTMIDMFPGTCHIELIGIFA